MANCPPKDRIIKGESKTITIRIKDSNGNNFDLTAATVTGKFPQSTAGSVLSKAGTITDATNGVMTVALTTAETATLKADPNYDFEVEIVKAGSTYIAPLKNKLNVEERVS